MSTPPTMGSASPDPGAASELFARAPDTFHRWLATVATESSLLYAAAGQSQPAALERYHTTAQVYDSYLAFAAAHGERHPLALPPFGQAMNRYAKQRRHVGARGVRGYDLGEPPGEALCAALADAMDLSGRQALTINEALAELDSVLKAARASLQVQWKAIEALEAVTVKARRRYEEMVRR